MKKNFFTVMLLLVSLAANCSAYAESGPPPLQEVEATGQGANADDAFKQAVVDAVRQVVGSLVTAENVVNNERVIKDEVLTLSNGFVEKVIKREQKKLADGTWEVKLKCTVRKGQVYARLKEANVPTVKFDGVSVFADVVSQLDHQKSSVEMIRNALKTFSVNLVTATMLEEKPAIVARNETHTDVKMTWSVSVDVDSFFKNCAPVLNAAFSGVALSKSKKPLLTPLKYTENSGFLLRNADTFDCGTDEVVPFDSIIAVAVEKQKNRWGIAFYRIDKRIISQVPRDCPEIKPTEMFVVAHFRDADGRPLVEVALDCLQFRD